MQLKEAHDFSVNGASPQIQETRSPQSPAAPKDTWLQEIMRSPHLTYMDMLVMCTLSRGWSVLRACALPCTRAVLYALCQSRVSKVHTSAGTHPKKQR